MTKRGNEDSLPPFSQDAEQGVLGCIFLSPDECLHDVIPKLKSDPNAFYDLRNQTIFRALVEMHENLDPVDYVSVHEHLKKTGKLHESGGIEYISLLPQCVPSAANLGYYLDTLIEKFQQRAILNTCGQVSLKISQGPVDHTKFLAYVRRKFDKALDDAPADLVQNISVDDLLNFNLDQDPYSLTGNRYQTKGSSLLINGPSGRGKSSLLMMRMMLHATGKPFLGVRVPRPMSFTVWQAENNTGDLARPFQSIMEHLGIAFEDEELDLIRKNIRLRFCPAVCGREFFQMLERDLTRHPTDFGVIDPLLAFTEDEITTARGASLFFRKGIFPIAMRTGVSWIINHHTPKPKEPNGNGGVKKTSDYQYAGAGSSDLAGAVRAVETLEESSDGIFRYIFAKRDGHGACHPDGHPTNIVWLRHATDGKLYWEQIPPPEEPEPQERHAGKPSKVNEICSMNLYKFCQDCTDDGESLNAIAKRLESCLASQNFDASLPTCKRAIPELVARQKLAKGQDGLYRIGENS